MADHETAKAAISLAAGGPPLPTDAPCCAWCAGVQMDCGLSPEPPAKMLERGRGCPLSICAYQIRAAEQQGSDVEVIPQGCGVPNLRVDGKVVDPLRHYGRERCGCPL